jgi:predicted GNAT family acetyltransferase
MADADLLDRPVWNSLRSGWAALAEGDGHALRLRQDHGPFGASAGSTAAELAALSALVPEEGELWVVELEGAVIPEDVHVARRGVLSQMLMKAFTPKHRAIEAIELGDADAPEMQALAAMTKPGPFASRTHCLGRFVGVRDEGRLVAMAGERMRIDGYCEVSGVCTHPDFQGRGLAGALMSIVCERMLARGETPFLHSYAHNEGAIGLYRSLGFHHRAMIQLTVLTAAGQGRSRLASP